MMEQTDYADLTAFAMGTPDRGFLNQILGALRAISELTGCRKTPDIVFCFLRELKMFRC